MQRRAREQAIRGFEGREVTFHRVRAHPFHEVRGKDDLLTRLLRESPQRHVRRFTRQIEGLARRRGSEGDAGHQTAEEEARDEAAPRERRI